MDGQGLLRSGGAACKAAPRVRDAGFAGAGIDFLKLPTIGARTGQPRTAPLAYIRTGEAFDQRLSEVRVREAVSTGADMLAVCCPFEVSLFEDAVKSTGSDGLIVRDIIELLDESLTST